jgi:acetolactate synthase-1/2/3 large subunit
MIFVEIVGLAERLMIDLYDFVTALNEASLPTDIINPSASGTSANIILQIWKVKPGQRFITNFVLGEMGAGLPFSIGAALATGKRIIHIEGDGGFQLNIQELETIRRLNLPIIMFIINNNGYHSIRTSQMSAFGRVTGADDSSGLTLPRTKGIAHAYGINYMELYHHSQTDFALHNGTPLICEVFADNNQQYRHRVPSKLVDGKMTTAPMDEV